MLATKVGNPMGEGPNEQRPGAGSGCSRPSTQSLERLGTDYIDIYYLHRDFDDDAARGDGAQAMGDIIRAGKVRYFGLSNFRGWRIAEVVRLCRRAGRAAAGRLPALLQRDEPQPEVEVLPACQYYGLGVVPYSPLARGVLDRQVPARRGAAGGHARRRARTSA